jgi:hypothetical protein
MTSFINLMANDVWSDADITRRTEAMVRTEFSLEAETILNRKVAGISLNQYTPTDADLDEMARFKEVVDDAQSEGVLARADNALLSQTMLYEAAMRRLDMEPIPDDIQDEAERADALALIDAASPEVVALYALRNPPKDDVPVEPDVNQNDVPTGE